MAKGEDTADSDIDLMVVSDELKPGEIQRHLYRTEHRLGRRISPMVRKRVEFEQERRAADSFVAHVLADPLLFVLGSMKDVDAITGI